MQIGCGVRVEYGEEVLEGTFITETPQFTLKLDSGYNLLLDKKRIKHIEVTRPPTPSLPLPKIKMQGQGKKIAILHTGGTVASKIDYTTGAVIAGFTPEDIIRMYPEITEHATITSRLISNMQSEMIRFPHYNLIAEAIVDEVKAGAEGIIITHGTDELHYTAAALSFMFDHLSVPVVLVASQRSSDRPSSDSRRNLVAGVIYAGQGKPEVVICMHEDTNDAQCIILPGLKSRKMHTTRRDAFKPINANPIARVHPEKNTIELLTPTPKHATNSAGLSYKKFNEHLKVGIVKARPQMYAEELLHYKDWDGLILEGLGLGHMPTEKIDGHTGENEKIYATLKKLAEKIPVALASQCIYGRVNMTVYTPGRELLNLGIMGNQLDMTPETAYIKLAYLLSTAKKEDIATLYHTNLRGEISERSEEK